MLNVFLFGPNSLWAVWKIQYTDPSHNEGLISQKLFPSICQGNVPVGHP